MEYSQNSYFSDNGSTVYSSNNSVQHIDGIGVKTSGYKNKLPVKRSKLGEFFVFLPVIFLLSVVFFFYSITLVYHLIPLNSQSLEIYENQFIYECTIYHILFILFIINYLLCLFINPGTIPDDSHWDIDHAGPDFKLLEKKKTGAPRQCRWCNKYKPDRTHHCDRCGKCVLKMDHHCPWTAKCVGFNNYKYFFLSVFYATLTLLYTVYILTPTSFNMLQEKAPFQVISMVLVVNVFALILALILVLFFNFHLWLLLRNKTTLEYLEGSNKANWDIGYYRNICSVLGSNPIMWLIPIVNKNLQLSDGLTFTTNDNNCNKYDPFFDDMEFENTTDIMNSNEIDDVNPDFITTSRDNELFKPIID